MPTIIINNKKINFEEGMNILQACELAGIEIPRFCYHDRLSIAGNCRMCLVEMEKSSKPVASCAMPAQDGMVIKTNTKFVKDARKGVMEFLLINHPLDCPICDQGGECDLQDQAMYYGYDKSRYQENKRAVKNKYLGPLISTIMTRCIHCTRCVRFSTEVAGVDDLGMLGRGENAEITSYLEKTVESELSGNVIDLCPVGALTNKPYEFKARPWELKKTETVDVFDAVGSNIRIDSIGQKVLRVLPRINEDINEEWINDKTRFAIDGLQNQRLDRPFIRTNGRLEETNWDTAISEVSKKIQETIPNNIISLSGNQVDVETLTATRIFFDLMGSQNYESRLDNAKIDPKVRSSYIFNSGISNIENCDSILLVGTNPRWEASILNARIRKQYLNNDIAIALIGNKKNLTYDYEYLGNSLKILENLYNDKINFSEKLKKSKKPMIIIGLSAISRKDGEAVLSLCRKIALKYNIVQDDWNGFNILNTNISKVGALDIGFYNNKFSNNTFRKIEEICSQKKSITFLLAVDEINTDILKESFVIYVGHHGDIGAQRADIILPSPAYTEKNSTFVNLEGRVMKSQKCHQPLGEAKEEWKIFRKLSDKLSFNMPFNNIYELRQEMSKINPIFNQLNILHNNEFKDFGKSGEILDEPILDLIKNFYMTDAISRASKTMSECSIKLKNVNNNLLQK
ncbi:MAG: NADH-quinone oxidoreductase chain 3 [Alphaproteobacteria bacterium MarineAlpha5_Bin12]|nr:MAG: NADH-quinone oxidoreductase chain 3 [Alphaproteobacteria bacterium MarineAlpha5_Bin12]|tara:strand:- start:6743 stop:8800 length:2058 start_codon:yes stop_codon:yes gene_type:complete